MKKILLLSLVLTVFCGCAAVNGVTATYIGLSPVVEVADGIYICNRYQVGDGLKKLGPKVAVLNLEYRIDDPPVSGIEEYKVSMHESDSPDTREKLAEAVGIIKSLRARGYIVVVHCWFGENRSPWVVANYLDGIYGGGWRYWFGVIKGKRPECYIKLWMF